MPLVFGQIKYNLNQLPEFFVAVLQVHIYPSFYLPLSRETFSQAFVSLRRIEKYLYVAEVWTPGESSSRRVLDITFQSATVGWPKIRPTSSERETLGNGFSLIDISTTFPRGELSLVCGKIASGKTLLLLGKSTNSIYLTMAD